MADFMAVTASNNPRIMDHEAVETVIARYWFEAELNLGVGFDHETGEPYLFIYGYQWPEAWKLAEGMTHENFDPYTEENYEIGADGFIELLKELALYLTEPLIVQAVGNTRCYFPLSACEWRIKPRAKRVRLTEFRGEEQPVKIGSTSRFQAS
jgi:hypothetical protein